MRAVILALALTVAGCAGTPAQVPRDVELMPTDCVNRTQILNWLQLQLDIARGILQSEQDYERQQSKLKHSIWNLRYRCQPV